MISELIGGLIVGIIARFIMPGKEALPSGIVGIILTAVLGIAGAFVGGFIARSLWRAGDDAYVAGWVMSILGAIILLALLRLVVGSGDKRSG
ncbi:MAG: GlsB/YeaQ/YmgE family stress response membrane protein [Acidobacteria bacterium]|nr:GlsB/YeaQ/YmgE family stress response membrane protein [Acidobacteriota bacterium]